MDKHRVDTTTNVSFGDVIVAQCICGDVNCQWILEEGFWTHIDRRLKEV
jgi:hypothetical protein